MNYLYAIQVMIWLLIHPVSSDYNPKDFDSNDKIVEKLKPTPAPRGRAEP